MTTNAPASLIERKIAEVMVAEPGLDALKRLYLGLPYSVPTEDYPYVSIVIDTERTEEEYTGGRVIRAYHGVIITNVLHQDIADRTERIARVPSYEVIREIMNTMIRLFKKQENRNLGGFGWSSGAVQVFAIADQDQVEYGVTALQDRENAFNNYGVIPFNVRTMETIL